MYPASNADINKSGMPFLDGVWRKFEQFNFPTSELDPQYETLERMFTRTKKIYVQYNFIDEVTQELDLQSLFLSRSHENIDKILGS